MSVVKTVNELVGKTMAYGLVGAAILVVTISLSWLVIAAWVDVKTQKKPDFKRRKYVRRSKRRPRTR